MKSTQPLADLATAASAHLDLARRAQAAGFPAQAQKHLGDAHTVMGHLLMEAEALREAAQYGQRMLTDLLKQGDELLAALAPKQENA